jgi:AcrR family transcriptional regulator
VEGENRTGPRRRLTRTEAKARTREQLLDAAAHTFARKGFARASVEEIAESAGYTIGALYSNFGSKEQLFLELLSMRTRQRAVPVAEILGADSEGGTDPVEVLSRLLVAIADSDTDLMPLQAEFWLYAVRNPAAMETFAARQRDQADALESLVTAAMRRLDVPADVPAKSVTTLILALFQGLLRQRRVDEAAVPNELVSQGLRWLLAGLRTA